ncbi:uncharacterized protein [Amphiura filiformis]|uniref:uncharacterized protein n=1 Tax=Amphiura filiformis TaxID=82378 RepID=UPI003B22203B
MQQQPPIQEPSGAMMSSNYNQHYASHPQGGQGGMMQPMTGQPQPGYMQSQQHRPMAASARLQHQLQQRASMQQVQQTVNQPGMPGGPQGGQPYMTHQLTPQQQQDRHRQLLQQQRYMGMQTQHPNNQAQQHHQQQQTADLVRQLQSQMSRGPSMGQAGPQPPHDNPYQYQI